MNYQWNYKAPTQDQVDAAAVLANETRFSPVMCQLLANRGFTTDDLHDPFLMKGMTEAVERLNMAMGNRERIMIYGDYDVDGCTAVALVYRFLQQYYSNIDYYIPDRYEEGYGVSIQGVDYAAERGVKLIIVLDCGIKAVDEIQYAKERGIDFIICDHHVPDAVLPPAVAILNAKMPDNTYPYVDLSGCGVGFKFMQAFAINNGIAFSHLIPLLDLVAVSIASDIVPIMGENRILAYHGLRQLNNSSSVGLKAIVDVCGLTGRDLTMADIIFKIGPRINASGRMQNGAESVALLVEHNYEKALERAEQINQYNDERKEMTEKMTALAVQKVNEGGAGENVLVVYLPECHEAVAGIVAGRIKESFYKPTFVITDTAEGDEIKGSGRSIEGYHMYDELSKCKNLLTKFGGHEMAAGFSLKKDDLDAFIAAVNSNESLTEDELTKKIWIDIPMPMSYVSMGLIEELDCLEPFGTGNPKPVFADKGLTVADKRIYGERGNVVKLILKNGTGKCFSAVMFKNAENDPEPEKDQVISVIYYPEINEFRGNKELQFIIQDFMV